MDSRVADSKAAEGRSNDTEMFGTRMLLNLGDATISDSMGKLIHRGVKMHPTKKRSKHLSFTIVYHIVTLPQELALVVGTELSYSLSVALAFPEQKSKHTEILRALLQQNNP